MEVSVQVTSWSLYTQKKETPGPKDTRLSGTTASLEALEKEKKSLTPTWNQITIPWLSSPWPNYYTN
jgi:hypothetical protein